MKLDLDIQRIAKAATAPKDSDFEYWIQHTLEEVVGKGLAHTSLKRAIDEPFELSVRIVDAKEMTELNHRYRGKNRPTNVLSFPVDLPNDVSTNLLGDVVISTDIVEKEALEQGKEVLTHWTHLTIHGTLHLLGFDHEDDREAEEMEQLEARLLAHFGFSNPYLVNA